MAQIKAQLVLNEKNKHHGIKWMIRILVATVLAVLLESNGIDIDKDGTVIPVLISIIGIIMPIAVSQSLAMPFDEIDNQDFVDGIRDNIGYVTKCFVYLLILATILFIKPYPDHEFKFKWLKASLYSLSDYYIFGILIYYCFNFLELIKLKYELSDEIRKIRVDKKFKEYGENNGT